MRAWCGLIIDPTANVCLPIANEKKAFSEDDGKWREHLNARIWNSERDSKVNVEHRNWGDCSDVHVEMATAAKSDGSVYLVGFKKRVFAVPRLSVSMSLDGFLKCSVSSAQRIWSFEFVWSIRKREGWLDSYVLLTICSLSPFLKVRSDAVRDS